MKKKFLGVIIASIFSLSLNSQGMEELADKTASAILKAFQGIYNIKTAVVRFENRSGHSDRTAQVFYQLLVARLENQRTILCRDLMIAFEKGSGKFNLNHVQDLNYLISLKLINHLGKLGAGWALFSKTQDRIVNLGFLESRLEAGERSMFEAVDLGFQSLGFFPEVEMDVGRALLDIGSIDTADGQVRYFLYFPDRIEVHRLNGTRMERVTTLTLTWGRPYHPAIEREGRLLVFHHGGRLYLVAGANVSPTSKVFVQEEGAWREGEGLPFVPFRLVEINDRKYLAGSRFMPGRNFYSDRILLAPLGERGLVGSGILEKRIPHFFSLDFAVSDHLLDSIHVIDRDYRYRYFASDFVERTADQDRRGASLGTLDGKWLAISDHTFGHDTLFFYKIEQGGRRPVYQNRLGGEVVFISPGSWKGRRGFWVYVKNAAKPGVEYRLQFWLHPPPVEPIKAEGDISGETRDED
jgi:hypothetical protein